MSKKKISRDNPRGVEYPKAVTADGMLVSALEIERDCEKWAGVRFFFPGCEGDEEEEMLHIIRKHKNGETKFFRHKPGYIENRNERDRYLHNYAELRLKERFDESEATGVFVVQYYVEEQCPLCADCKLRKDIKCQGEQKVHLKELNLREFYDTCKIEKGEDKFIADLLLTNSKDENIPPIFLEVFVTHKCSEEKLNSGYQIIEIKIESEKDADNAIIENSGDFVDDHCFMRSENEVRNAPIMFYNFNRSVAFSKFVQYKNFVLTKQGDEFIGDYRSVACNEIQSIALPENHALSLYVPDNEIGEMDVYEMGMALAQHSGLAVRDCTLCCMYKIPHWQGGVDSRSCRIVNCVYSGRSEDGKEQSIPNPYIFQLPYRCNGFDKSKLACGGNRYLIDRKRIQQLVCILENKHKIISINDGLFPCADNNPKQSASNKDEKPAKKLIKLSQCLNCPIHRNRCGHRLGMEKKYGQDYVICDWVKD
ncbi:MAG: hypothetical protein J1E58_05275 [Prevotella sp.]|nr:hypothetical protein [Prevotella sp.]